MEVATSIREEDGKTQVTVTMSADEVKKHVDAFFKNLSKNRIPGFRPGKAPRKVLEQNFGGHDYIYAQITTDMINEVAPVAVDQQDILYISDPEFNEEEIGTVTDGEDYTFVVYGEVKPEVELSSYDPVEIELPSEHATDADVELQLSALREYYSRFEDADRAAGPEDYAVVDLEATADGKAVDTLSGETRLVKLSDGLLPASVAEQIVGLKPGDAKEFDVTIDDDDDYAYLEGKPVHVKVTVHNVRVKKSPELDDAFAEQVGFSSLDELRKEIREDVETQKSNALPNLKERRCVDELATRIEGDIPTTFINFTRQDILRDFFKQLQQQNMTFDQFLTQQGIGAEEFQKDLDEQAEESARQGLALDALARHLDVQLTEEDIDNEFRLADVPEVTRKSWEDAGRMSVLREALRRRKAMEWLEDNAVVTVEDESAAE